MQSNVFKRKNIHNLKALTCILDLKDATFCSNNKEESYSGSNWTVDLTSTHAYHLASQVQNEKVWV